MKRRNEFVVLHIKVLLLFLKAEEDQTLRSAALSLSKQKRFDILTMRHMDPKVEAEEVAFVTFPSFSSTLPLSPDKRHLMLGDFVRGRSK